MSDRTAAREKHSTSSARPEDDASLFKEAAMESKRLKAFLDAQQFSATGMAPPSAQPERLVMHTDTEFGESADVADDADDFESLESAESNARDSWPWDDDLDDADDWREIDGAESADDPELHEIDDHSATEDVVLLRASDEDGAEDDAAEDEFAQIDEMLEDFAPEGDDDDEGAKIGGDSTDAAVDVEAIDSNVSIGPPNGLASATPKRIGSGQLIPARLTWRPGDPFAMPPERPSRPFRWDLMLTSASVTAGCGLVGLWLLRTLLA